MRPRCGRSLTWRPCPCRCCRSRCRCCRSRCRCCPLPLLPFPLPLLPFPLPLLPFPLPLLPLPLLPFPLPRCSPARPREAREPPRPGVGRCRRPVAGSSVGDDGLWLLAGGDGALVVPAAWGLGPGSRECGASGAAGSGVLARIRRVGGVAEQARWSCRPPGASELTRSDDAAATTVTRWGAACAASCRRWATRRVPSRLRGD